MSDERTNWIQRRAAEGYDWTPFVEALAKVRVRMTDGEELDVDFSEIMTDPHMPKGARLTPTSAYPDAGFPDDHDWFHDDAGTSGTLFDQLAAFVLMALELPERISAVQTDGEDDHG